GKIIICHDLIRRSPLPGVNRWLLNDHCRLATDNLLYAAVKRGLDSGFSVPSVVRLTGLCIFM
ncbi:hypothetical protein, partial [Erwinia sp.]|uniref:hypothetical protein n=1 Tax=Erwinia citreus TaxID=558 RepID=UPI00289B96C2